MSNLHGEGRTLALAGGPVPDAIVVALGAARVPDAGGRVVVRFAATRVAPGELLVAPSGEELWRREPWPAADALFDLPPPRADAPVLVVGAGERVAEALRERGGPVRSASLLTRGALEDADVVVLGDPAGLPPHAFAVLAARRLLVLGEGTPLFGLQGGIHCLTANGPEELAAVADVARSSSPAFAAVRALGALAAESRRASRVYARLAVDVALEREGEARKARRASST